jgi:hypothetical protein
MTQADSGRTWENSARDPLQFVQQMQRLRRSLSEFVVVCRGLSCFVSRGFDAAWSLSLYSIDVYVDGVADFDMVGVRGSSPLAGTIHNPR